MEKYKHEDSIYFTKLFLILIEIKLKKIFQVKTFCIDRQTFINIL